METATVTGASYTAVLVGQSRAASSIENCHISGDINVTGTGSFVAGIVGGAQKAGVNDCSVSGTGTISGDYAVGGIIGIVSEGMESINNNSVNGVSVTGNERVGGIAGSVLVAAEGLKVQNNAVENVTVSVSTADAGLIIGQYNKVAGKVEIAENTVVSSSATEAGVPVTNLYGDNLEVEYITFVAKIGTEYYSSIQAALAAVKSGDTLVLLDDVTVAATNGGYSKAGIVQKGFDIDGNGHTLNVTGANTTWDCAIYTTGGTIKNLTIDSGFRGVFTAGQNSDIILDNVTIDGPTYTFSTDNGNKMHEVIIKNSTLNGWTSYADVYKAVTFENCTFGEGSGFAHMIPYADTTYISCNFTDDYSVDARADVKMTDCTIDGTPMTAEDVAELLGGSVEASIGDVYYDSFNDAFAAAVDGDTITLHADCAVDNFNSTQDLTFDLNNNKFTFADANSVANENRHMVSHNITFKNGSIDIKADEFVNITATGAVTLDNVTSEMLGRTNTTFYVYGALKIVNGSDIKISTTGNAITSDYDWNVLNIDASTVTVDGAYLAYNNGDLNLNNGGKFIAKNIAGSAFNSVEAELTSGSEIVIDNAAYHGFTNGSLSLTDSTMTVTDAGYYGVNLTNDCTLDNSTLIVENCDLAKGRSGKSINVGAGKSLNVTNNSTVEVKGDGTTIYLANDTSSAIKDAVSNIIGEIVTGNVTSEDSVASEVKLTFEPTAKKEVYNIYVEAVEGTINRMSAVQVKFALDNANMSYTLAPASELGVTLTNDIDDEEAYVFNYNGVSTPDRTGTKLLLGTVTFGGYGNFNFTVDEGFNNKIKTAQTTDNIVEEYVPTPILQTKNRAHLTLLLLQLQVQKL